MKNQRYIIAIAGIFLITACKNEPEAGYDPVTNSDREYSPTESSVKGDSLEPEMELNEVTEDSEEATTNPDRNNSGTEKSISSNTKAITGIYVKMGEKSDANCGCYCLDIRSNTNTELCLVPNEMYINTRLQKNSNNSIDVFLVGPSNRNTGVKEVPWDKFDKNNAIAKITPSSNGELKLDWLGFKINGDLAIDYAIYGKKTLEGNYQKK